MKEEWREMNISRPSTAGRRRGVPVAAEDCRGEARAAANVSVFSPHENGGDKHPRPERRKRLLRLTLRRCALDRGTRKLYTARIIRSRNGERTFSLLHGLQGRSRRYAAPVAAATGHTRSWIRDANRRRMRENGGDKDVPAPCKRWRWPSMANVTRACPGPRGVSRACRIWSVGFGCAAYPLRDPAPALRNNW